MSRNIRRVLPLVAAPVVLIALASNATAVIDPYPSPNNSDGSNLTEAYCAHPYDSSLYFVVDILTGEEGTPEGLDVSDVEVFGVDDNANPDGGYRDPNVQAKHLRWQYGIIKGFGKDKEFEGTSGVFSAGASIRNGGDHHSGLQVSDVQAIWFEYVWKVASATRTVSCVVKLDGYYYN